MSSRQLVGNCDLRKEDEPKNPSGYVRDNESCGTHFPLDL